jgi:hypothetical protein
VLKSANNLKGYKMLSQEFTVQMSGFRRKVRKWYFVNGLSLCLIAISIFSIITFILDWFIPDLPKTVRIFFLSCGLLSAFYILLHYLIYPVTKRISNDDIAISLENYYPFLKGRLISSLQLARSLEINDKFNSSKLVSELITDTSHVVKSIDIDVIVDLFPIKRILMILCGLLLVIFAYTGCNPLYAGIWFNRILGGDIKWPKKTLLKVIVKSHVIPKGQDFNVEVIALKGSPERVYLYYELANGENNFERMTKTANGRFRFNFSRVQNYFRFFAKGGDDQTEWISVKTLISPSIEQIKIWYEYPSYTKFDNTPYDKPEMGGVIRAPLGTKINLGLSANIPIDSAELKIFFKKMTDKVDLNIIGDKNDSREINGFFFVLGDADYSITLKAKNGLENAEAIKYPIKVVMDTAPIIKIIEPKTDIKYVTATATLPMVLETIDDYGIQQISFFNKISTRDPVTEQKIFFSLQQNDNPYGSRKIETKYDFELSRLGVKEGDIVNYYFEAEDNCAISNTNRTRTRELKLNVVSESTIQKKIEEIQMRIKDEVRKTLNLQDNLKNELNQSNDFFMRIEKFNTAEQRSMQGYLSRQRRVTQTLERIKKEFDDVISDVLINKLWDNVAQEKLKSINSMIENIAKEQSPRASELISNSSTASDLTERKLRLDKLSAEQGKIISNLKEILSKMEEWEDYQEVVKIIKELIEKQQKIINSIKGENK